MVLNCGRSETLMQGIAWETWCMGFTHARDAEAKRRMTAKSRCQLLLNSLYFFAMAKRHHKRRRKRQSTSSSSNSSSSSESSSSSSASSSSSSSLSAAAAQQVSPASRTDPDNLHVEKAVYILNKQGLLRNQVLVQTPEVDPTDGIIVYAATSKGVHAHSCAKHQLLSKFPT